jgi:hypothetical protein
VLSGTRGWLVRRKILDQNRDVLDAAAELFWQRIQGFFSNVDEVFALHPSPLTQTAHPHRVASVILFLVVTLIVRGVSFIFLIVIFFLVWFLPKKDIASRRTIRTVCVETLCAYSAHVHMVLYAGKQEQRVLVAGEGASGNARIGVRDPGGFRAANWYSPSGRPLQCLRYFETRKYRIDQSNPLTIKLQLR